MNQTSNETDLSSIITQVPRDDEINRTTNLPNTLSSNGTTTTTTRSRYLWLKKNKRIVFRFFDLLDRSNGKRRFVSLLLCCLSVSRRNRSKSAIYSPKSDTPAHEVSSTKTNY